MKEAQANCKEKAIAPDRIKGDMQNKSLFEIFQGVQNTIKTFSKLQVKGANKLRLEMKSTLKLKQDSLVFHLDHTVNTNGEGEPIFDEEIILEDKSKELKSFL